MVTSVAHNSLCLFVHVCVYVCVCAFLHLFCRYRWAFVPEASDDSGLEVRRQGTHQREFKPYVVRLAKLLRKRAKVGMTIVSLSLKELELCCFDRL